MLHAIRHCHNTSLCNSTRMLPPFLPFDEPKLCNDYLFKNSEYNDRLCFLNQGDLDNDLLNNVILHQLLYNQPKNQVVQANTNQNRIQQRTQRYHT